MIRVCASSIGKTTSLSYGEIPVFAIYPRLSSWVMVVGSVDCHVSCRQKIKGVYIDKYVRSHGESSTGVVVVVGVYRQKQFLWHQLQRTYGRPS